MSMGARVVLATVAIIFSTTGLLVVAQEHNHGGEGGEYCGPIKNFTNGTDYRHGGVNATPPSGYYVHATLSNRSYSGESNAWPNLAESYPVHAPCTD